MLQADARALPQAEKSEGRYLDERKIKPLILQDRIRGEKIAEKNNWVEQLLILGLSVSGGPIATGALNK